MTVIFAGAMHYEFGNVLALDTIPGRFDPDYALGAISKNGVFNYANVFIENNVPELWLHARVFFPATTTAGSDRMICFGAVDSSGGFLGGLSFFVNSIKLSADNSDLIISGNGIDVTGVIPREELIDIDIHIYEFGASRIVELFIAGVMVARRTKTLAWVNANQLVLAGPYVNQVSFSEVIVCQGNEPTLGWRLHSKRPNAALPGLNSFDQGYWGSLGNDDLSDGVVTRSAGARITGGFQTYTGPATPLGIRGIMQSARYLKNSTVLDLVGQLRIAGVNYDTADSENKDASRIMSFWELNPATGEPFDVSDFSGLEGGFRTVAIP